MFLSLLETNFRKSRNKITLFWDLTLCIWQMESEVVVPSSSALKTEASIFPGLLVPIFQIALPHVPQKRNLNTNAVRNPNIICFFTVVIFVWNFFKHF
jgi:hypothetical protein